ncbi:tetratricopeptide repeat protein [Paracoccus aminophilus]|nr:tetratricopeptide repeat protein [Paracoccus aminophilus]
MLDTGQPQAAIDNFKTAARAGNPAALNTLGRIYERGWGVPADATAAAVYYSRAADLGEAWAMFNLGELYLSGHGVPQSDAEAFRLYSAAAAKDHAKALNMLGMMAEAGRCPNPASMAQSYFTRAAELGECWAQFNLARLLIQSEQIDEGLEWVDRSLAEGAPAYLRTIADAMSTHPDERIRKRGAWAEALFKRHQDHHAAL